MPEAPFLYCLHLQALLGPVGSGSDLNSKEPFLVSFVFTVSPNGETLCLPPWIILADRIGLAGWKTLPVI
jgi:hypothetical protein